MANVDAALERQPFPKANSKTPQNVISILVVTVCSLLATLMQALDSTIANVALPYMQGSMAASQDEINWVLTSYIIASAITTAPTGFLVARFGRTKQFVTCILGFTIASVACGAAQTLDQLVIFRLVQGAFGGALVPLSQSVMFDTYAVEQRGKAMALWGMGVQVGPVIGPILGGWLTQDYSWRWVFYVNVPFGLIAAAGLLFYLKETPHGRDAKLDWIGFAALSIGVGALQLMLDRGEQRDWFSSPEIVLEACLAGLGLYIFLVQFFLAPKPFLSPRMFADLNFDISIVCVFIVGLILFATLALLAPYLQELMNYPVITAGLVLAPRGAGTMLAMIASGRLLGRISARVLVGIGFVTGAVALYEMTCWTPDVSESSIIVTGFIQGLSVGFVFVPLSTIVFATLPLELRTEAAGVYSLLRNLGSAIGISITGSILISQTQVNHAIIAATITPFDRVLQTGAATKYLNPATNAGAALLNSAIDTQASVISYIDDFKLMLVLSIAALPLLLLIRSPRQAAQITAGAPAAPLPE